jgi:pimeloyl-ACP methyl ester carboxylesterase
MRERFVNTRFGNLAVFDDETDLPAVVLLHGLGGDHEQALGLVPAEASSFLRRIAIDMRAHGATTDIGPEETLTVRHFAEDVHAVLSELNSQAPLIGPSLVGVSMGGAVTLEYAVTHPETIAAMVIVRPAWAGEKAPSSSAVFPVLGSFLRHHGPDGLQPFMETTEYQAVAAASEVVAASLRKQFTRQDGQRRAAVLERIPCSEVSGLTDLKVIEVPSLVLAAPDDPVHRFDYGKALAAALPDGRLRVLPRKELEPGAHEDQSRASIAEFLLEVTSR